MKVSSQWSVLSLAALSLCENACGADSDVLQGTDYEVPDMDFYKRAVLKPAPTCFTVEVLPPAKQGTHSTANFSYCASPLTRAQ